MKSKIIVWAAGVCLLCTGLAMGQPAWTSPNRYHLDLQVNPRGVTRSHSPASVNIDFVQTMANRGIKGTFDEHSIEVVAYNDSGKMVIYDPSRAGYEQYLLPWRIQKYYGIDEVTLSFVLPSHAYTRYRVFFDTVESGHGKPQRYHGLVGNGDFFSQGYGRREIGPSKFGTMCDFDGDGDLDLFEGGIEPFVYCHESLYTQTGQHRYVNRGRLASNGELFVFPRSKDNRGWMAVSMYDWDGDGDQDLFPSFSDGPDIGHIVFYRNTTDQAGGRLTFERVGQWHTDPGSSATSEPIGGVEMAKNWFPTPTFVKDFDGDGDGLTDVLVAKKGGLYLHRNLGPGGPTDFRLANGVQLTAGGRNIELRTPRVECVDIDGDNDLDLLAATHSDVYWYKNIGTRQKAEFAAPIKLVNLRAHYCGLKVADFVGNDGLLDIAIGVFWYSNADKGKPKSYGGLLKNLGPRNDPKFKLILADAGAPYTEQYQIINAGQQNGVRSMDLDNDGDHDLVASSSDGFALFYRNLNNDLWPIFAPVKKLSLSKTGKPVRVWGPEAGYGRLDLADWNNDGHIDLIIADESGDVFLFLNDGTGSDPPTFLEGTPVQANGKPIDGTGRGSVVVCDWNNDGKKDLILGMAYKANITNKYHDWPAMDEDKNDDQGFLFYKNVGTDAKPVLAYPDWLRADGKIITYVRPNLGSFVDWDGDGKKDFIGCMFESDVRLYRNVRPGPADNKTGEVLPILSPADGIILVRQFCRTQMVSGADAIDWRGDGDLDILTGKGHSGAGLYFYERDYIDDFVNNTYPVVTVMKP